MAVLDFVIIRDAACEHLFYNSFHMVPVLHYSDLHVGMGSWRNVQMNVFTRQLQLSHLSEIRNVRATLLEQYPEGVLSMVLVEPTAISMPPEVRQPTVALMHEISKSTVAGCYVFSGGGVMMTTIRTVVSAMMLASRPPRPTKTFTDLRTAGVWMHGEYLLSPKVRESYSAEELIEALRFIERQHLSRSARQAALP